MIPVAEQETVIQFNRDQSVCTIWTSDSTVMTKLDKLCKTSEFYKLVKETKTQDGEIAGKFYELSDKTRVSFRGTKVQYTDEQKAAMAERLRGIMNHD
jgi:hypothetical protein